MNCVQLALLVFIVIIKEIKKTIGLKKGSKAG
jgi:hypothetical protein